MEKIKNNMPRKLKLTPNTLSIGLFFLLLLTAAANAAAVTRTWDGGGATNNWSDAANWSGDVAPTSADDLVFNNTSVKNSTVDTGLTVNSVSINGGYSGTITQNSVLTVTNAFTQSAGTFQGTAANANFGYLVLNAGSTFNAPTGTLSLTSQVNYYIFTFNGGTFNANGGTVNANGRPDTNYFSGAGTPVFNNLTISQPLIVFSTINVNGMLTINAALSNAQVNVGGNVIFGGSNPSGSTVLNYGGTATRTATISGTTVGNPVTVNNPNLTLTTGATSGDVIWNQKVTLQAGTLNQTAANYIFSAAGNFNAPGFEVSGGTFNGSAGNAIFNTTIGISSGSLNGGMGDLGTNAANCPAYPQASYYFQQSGGTFSGGAGNVRFCDMRRTGGAFVAPSGNLTILSYGDLAGGTFNANNGTLIIANTVSVNAPGFTLNNVTLSGANGHGITGTPKPIINGTLNLAEGQLGGDVAVNGDVVYGANFTGGGGRLFFEGILTRTISLPARNILLGMTLDNPNITVTTSDAGASTFTGAVEVKRGLLRQGSGNLTLTSTLTVSGGTFQGSAAALANNGTYINIVISSGIFNSGAGAISVGTINTSGGTFNGGSGDIEVARYEQSGGVFNAPSGTITVVADWTHTAGGTFNAGMGSVKLTGYNVYNCANSYTSDVNVTETFYNLEIANAFCDQRYITTGDTLIVTNDLRLSAAKIAGGRIRPLGTVTIDASNAGYTGSTVVEYITPNQNFVINNPSAAVNMLPVEMNAANSTLTSSGSGKINFYAMTLTNGTLNQPNAVWDFSAYPGYTQSGGIFNGSAAQLNISNGINGNILTGGTFNGGTGLINGGWGQSGGTFATDGDMNVGGFNLTGGTFNAPLGTLSLFNGFSHTGGGTFNARTGTVQTSTAVGVYGMGFDVNSTETFNNLMFNGTNNNANHGIAAGDTLVVNGTLTFNGRAVSGGSIVANGNVAYPSYGAYQTGTTIVKFQDAAARTVTFCTGASCDGTIQAYIQPTLINNPNITVNAGLTANGVMNFGALTLQQGTFNQGDGRVNMGSYNQSGGIFKGGTYNGNTNLNNFADFTLTGGDFNAAPTMTLTGNFTHTTVGGDFNEGTGTVFFYSTFNGTNGIVDVNGSENFYNVRFSSGNGTNIAAGDTLIVNGTTTLQNGTINGGTIDVKGSVNVLAPNVGGNSQGGTASVIFSGATDQTFANPAGFRSFGGTWTVNKPVSTSLAENSFAAAAPTNLLISGNVGSTTLSNYVPLNVVSGNVLQTGSYALALASLNVANGSRMTNDFGGALTLAGNVVNDGVIALNGGGSGCGADTISIRSSVAGTQRSWNGTGAFLMVDTDVKDQAGTPMITVYSGTNSGNNGANWVFNGSCLQPTAAHVSVSGRVLTADGRGIANVAVVLTDAQGESKVAVTNPFGYYRFTDIAAGQTVVLSPRAKRYNFPGQTQVLNLSDNLSEINFTAESRP